MNQASAQPSPFKIPTSCQRFHPTKQVWRVVLATQFQMYTRALLSSPSSRFEGGGHRPFTHCEDPPG